MLQYHITKIETELESLLEREVAVELTEYEKNKKAELLKLKEKIDSKIERIKYLDNKISNTKIIFSLTFCSLKKLIVSTLILFTMIAVPSVQAESLFTLGAQQQYQGVPRSLFGGVQARQIGDLISIIMSENIKNNAMLSYLLTTSKLIPFP